MSTPCSQSLRPNRLVVSEYKVPKVLVSRKWVFFIETLCRYTHSHILPLTDSDLYISYRISILDTGKPGGSSGNLCLCLHLKRF